MKKLFVIAIGIDDKGQYFAQADSIEDRKTRVFKATTLKFLLDDVSKTLRKKRRQNVKFPPPEPSKIITLDNDHSESIIVPARN